jgi:hypothetical protein
MNVDQFNAAVKDWAQKYVPSVLRDAQRKLCLDGLNGLVMKTPVDTGRARGGWQAGINQRPAGQVERLDKDGTATIEAGKAVVENVKAFDACYITDNVHYILKLEDGHSGQAPNGMLSVTVEELVANFA